MKNEKSLLEEIWCAYTTLFPEPFSREDKPLCKELEELEEKLTKCCGEEFEEIFETFKDVKSDLYTRYIERAFIKGVRFGGKLLIEIMCKE